MLTVNKLLTFLFSKYALEVSGIGIGGIFLSSLDFATGTVKFLIAIVTLFLLILKGWNEHKKRNGKNT